MKTLDLKQQFKHLYQPSAKKIEALQVPTADENPAIVDVDGDFATEIVVTRTSTGTCPAVDPLNPSSGAFAESTGFVILRDPQDRWASSRPIWNQHDYHVTNVSDDGRVPKSSDESTTGQSRGSTTSARTCKAAWAASCSRISRSRSKTPSASTTGWAGPP